jgi:DNA-binding HxlR family transcriptional regulator
MEPDPDDEVERGREAALARREALSSAERERMEATVADLLDLFGKAHAMAVLRTFALSTGPWRFSELEDELGVSPNTLSARLGELVSAGLLVRRSYDEIPPRVEYEATEKAEALFPAFGHIHRWAEEHRLEPVGADDEATSDAAGTPDAPDGTTDESPGESTAADDD